MTQLSAFVTTLEEARGVIDRMERALESARQTVAAVTMDRAEANARLSNLRQNYSDSEQLRDELTRERDAARAALREICDYAGGTLMTLTMTHEGRRNMARWLKAAGVDK